MMNEREELQVKGYYVVVITKLRVQYGTVHWLVVFVLQQLLFVCWLNVQR